jgi:hypothetical protein
VQKRTENEVVFIVRANDLRKGCGRVNMVEMYVLMYENGKRDLLRLFWEWRGRGIKENDGGGEFNYGIL